MSKQFSACLFLCCSSEFAFWDKRIILFLANLFIYLGKMPFFLTVKPSLFFGKRVCRSGETGRRSGLKIHRAIAHAGSIPAFGTKVF